MVINFPSPTPQQIDSLVAAARAERSAALGILLADLPTTLRRFYASLFQPRQSLTAKHSS